MKKCEKIPKCVKKKKTRLHRVHNKKSKHIRSCLYILPKNWCKDFCHKCNQKWVSFFFDRYPFFSNYRNTAKKLKLIPTMYIYSKWTDIFNLTWLLIGFMHKFNGQCILSTVIYHHLTYFFDIIVITLKAYYLPNVQPLNHPKWAYLTLRGH